MAPADAAARRQPRENQYLFDLGVKGRKTGVTVPDNGVRDEHGLEPIDGLFSSPAKPAPKSSRSTHKTNGANGNATLSSSEDMDINDSTVPEPQDLLTERKRANMRLPPPRSKSPIKTYLQSPARRNPGYDPRSSPTRPSVVRRLDFSVNGDDYDQNSHEESLPDSSARGGRALSHPVNGTRLSPPANDNEDDEIGQLESYGDIEIGDNSLQQVEYNEGPEEPSEEPEVADGSELEPELPTKASRKRKTTASEPAESVPKRGRGRPAAKQKTIVNEVEEQVETQDEEQDEEDRPTKRRRSGRHSLEGPAETLETAKAPNKSKPGRPKKSDNVIKKAASVSEASKQKPTKPAGRKQKLPVISEVDSPEVTRGPPMPKNNRGLVILRRETPGVAGGFQQTRSGRNSIKPLAYWRGERVEWDEAEEATDGYSKFLLPAIKEVVRTEESVVNAAGKKSHKRGKKGKKRAVESDSEDDDEIEPWEVEPGRIVGEVREWDPQDPLGQETMDKEEELALSSAAIITREIAGATFKFAKTLTLPFFGSGMVDLPPGAVKKPKNSRKMQMAFFVHYGRVEVSVNDNVFRIGKGGMWQVPRGNFYSITNDYDKPARIFFSQGNEVEAGTSEASA